MAEMLTSARRVPSQSRSELTVERILDAAESIVRKVPMEYVTPTRIAKEAGLSIGALYRFYQDKQAVFDAVATRHAAQFREILEYQVMCPWERERKAGTAAFNPIKFLEDVIDTYVGYLDKNPGFRAIALGQGTRAREASPISGFATVLRKFLLEQVRVPETPELNLTMCVVSEISERLIGFAFEQELRGKRELVIGELKRLLAGYLFVRNG